jgi:ATP-binding cassette subfamily C protein LapB
MDSTLESRLIRDLPKFLAGRTVVLATHRMQLLNLVERIIWMDQGKIVADGPKAEILSSFPKAA